jgi:CO/xanthine dehydrogenase Mo-binding subunit
MAGPGSDLPEEPNRPQRLPGRARRRKFAQAANVAEIEALLTNPDNTKLGMDSVELRMKNFIKPEQFPYHSALGWEYDSGNYHAAMQKVMDAVDYPALRARPSSAARHAN